MLDIHLAEPDVARLITAEKERAARRVIASVRDKDNVRTHFALCDVKRTFVDIGHCNVYAELTAVENQLRVKRNGINQSLGKVARMKRTLGVCADANGADTQDKAALAAKLYAMADELQALLAM